MDLWTEALNQVWMVPSVVLRVISYVFLTFTRAFSIQEPIPFSKAHALSYSHNKVGSDRMHICGELTSRKWSLSMFLRGRPESQQWFQMDYWRLPVHFRGDPLYFPNIEWISDISTYCEWLKSAMSWSEPTKVCSTWLRSFPVPAKSCYRNDLFFVQNPS